MKISRLVDMKNESAFLLPLLSTPKYFENKCMCHINVHSVFF